MSVSAYPLQWPEGWPRTPFRRRVNGKSRWSSKGKPWTFDAARRELAIELDRLGAQNIVLSTNYELRLDGAPRAGARVPDDVGIAVYFAYKGRQVAMARDAFDRAEENIRSLTLALKAMRAIEEHGGSLMMDRAFEGFMALPAPGAADSQLWWKVLRVEPSATEAEIQTAYRKRAAEVHPDRPGGSAVAMAEVNAARDAALQAVR
ncbi:MAG TPA: J domain-containing protein [Pararhizobium sp.]|nr:J domain-containing protein [Pararhizobium sp.]